MKPKIFIGSSVEGLSVAYSIQQNLTHDAEVTVWDQGVFELSRTTIESLLEVLERSDFGIFVFSQDDISIIRDESKNVIRDNVLFEFGLFIGKLGRGRVFFVIPSDTELHLPTDLIGITPGKYDPNREDKSLQAATGPVCHQIRQIIKKQGIIVNNEDVSEIPEKKEIFNKDANDWVQLFIDHKYSEAKELLEKQIENESDLDTIVEKKVWVAYCQFKNNELSGVENINDLLKEYESNIIVYKGVARIYLWEDYIDKSFEIITKAITKFGEEPFVNLLAEYYKKENDEEKALEFLLSKSPENNVDITLEIIELYKNQKDFEKARNVIHKTYLNYPNNEKLRYNYALISTKLNENSIALYFLSSLISEFPKNPTYWGYYSNCCVDLDLYDEAMTACKKANELAEEKQSWIISNIGNILKNKGFYSDAIEYLEKSLKIKEDSDYAHDRIAISIKLRKEEQDKVNDLSNEGRKLLRQYIAVE